MDAHSIRGVSPLLHPRSSRDRRRGFEGNPRTRADSRATGREAILYTSSIGRPSTSRAGLRGAAIERRTSRLTGYVWRGIGSLCFSLKVNPIEKADVLLPRRSGRKRALPQCNCIRPQASRDRQSVGSAVCTQSAHDKDIAWSTVPTVGFNIRLPVLRLTHRAHWTPARCTPLPPSSL